MGAALCGASPAAREIFATADRITNSPITELCSTGTIEQLTRTDITQVCVFTTSLAAAAALAEELGYIPQPLGVAGHSVGELSAMCWSGALPLEDALRLVQERGRLM